MNSFIFFILGNQKNKEQYIKNRKDKISSDDERKFLDRVIKYCDNHLFFLNNRADADLREIIIKKIMNL